MSARRRSSSPVLLALLLAGCAVALPTLRSAIPEDARRLVALLDARRQAFSDLRTLAEIDVDRPGARTRLTGVLLARAPASVRFEALSPFGQPLLIVTIHDGRLTSYDLAANEAVVGPANADTAGEFLHLPLEPEELVLLLGGHVLPPADLRAAEVQPPDDLGPSLLLIGAAHRQRVWMDPEGGAVRQVEIAGGRAQAVVTLHRDSGGTPAGFDLETAPLPLRATVRYLDPVVGAGIDPGRFRLALPRDATIRPLR